MSDYTEKYISSHLFLKREEGFEHAPFDREIACYESICSGNIELVKLFATPLCGEGYGILSKDPLKNLKYQAEMESGTLTLKSTCVCFVPIGEKE